VFGRKKFHGYVEARRTGDRRIDHLASNLATTLVHDSAPLLGDDERFGVFNRLAMVPFLKFNSARLLIDGTKTFDAIFAAIESATAYVLVQFFIIRDDTLGRTLQARLMEKARQGLAVYVLYDEIGSIGLSTEFFIRLREAGVHVYPFNTRRGWRNRFQ